MDLIESPDLQPAEAFELGGPERGEGRDVSRRIVGDRTDEDLAGVRALLEPGGGVHDRANAHLLLRVRGRRKVHDGLSGLESDAHAERELGCRPRCRPGPGTGRGAQRALGIIVVGDRCAEERVDRVADVLLHRPALGFDDRAQRGERLIERGFEPFRAELHGELGRADDVDEERRDEASLFRPGHRCHVRNATSGTAVPIRRPIAIRSARAQPAPAAGGDG